MPLYTLFCVTDVHIRIATIKHDRFVYIVLVHFSTLIVLFSTWNNNETIPNYLPKIPESFLYFVDLLCRHIYSLCEN